MKNFKTKIGTHTVFKNDDVRRALTPDEIKALGEIQLKICAYRVAQGKEEMPMYYVINHDEPYAQLISDVIRYGEMSK